MLFFLACAAVGRDDGPSRFSVDRNSYFYVESVIGVGIYCGKAPGIFTLPKMYGYVLEGLAQIFSTNTGGK